MTTIGILLGGGPMDIDPERMERHLRELQQVLETPDGIQLGAQLVDGAHNFGTKGGNKDVLGATDEAAYLLMVVTMMAQADLLKKVWAARKYTQRDELARNAAIVKIGMDLYNSIYGGRNDGPSPES